MRPFFYRGRFVFIPLGIAAFLTIISYVVMQLWNHLLPDILHVGTITFWQAMGIFILSKILFGFGKGRGFKGGHDWRHDKMWQMKERMHNMSPEQREQFKQKMKERMCDFRGRRGRGGRGGFDWDWDDLKNDGPANEPKTATE